MTGRTERGKYSSNVRKTDTLFMRPGDIGVFRALIEPYLLKVKEVGLPAWFEALDELARDGYAHFAFELW